jgi:hypothetical protein
MIQRQFVVKERKHSVKSLVCSSLLSDDLVVVNVNSSRSQWPRGLGNNYLRFLECWDREFESQSRHKCLYCMCLFRICVVTYVDRGPATA